MLSRGLNSILALPENDQEHFDNVWLTWSILYRKHPDAPMLKPAQGAMLEHLSKAPPGAGAFGSIGVGGGKTLINLLGPTVVGAKRPLVLLPPGLDQELDRQYEIWKDHYPVVRPATLTYPDLSRAEGAYTLERLNPDLIICDEAHNLRHLTSARTKRVRRFHAANPACRFVFMSGTMTGGHLYHFAHLLFMALGKGSPAPIVPGETSIWDCVLSSDGEALADDYEQLVPLLDWANEEDYLKAHAKRIACTPGVVCTQSASVDASIHLVMHQPKLPSVIQDALDRFETSWEYPDGTEEVDAAQAASAMANLSVGFYYKMGDVPSQEWADARASWFRELRILMTYRSRAGFDSALLIETEIRSTTRGYHQARAAMAEWDKHKHIKRPPSETVWLDQGRYLKGWLAGWAKANPKALIWCQSVAVQELLADAGYDVRGAGAAPPDAPGLYVLSDNRFKEGFNLQFMDTAVMVEPRPSGGIYDQMIGRQHREGQTSDCVTTHILQASAFQRRNFRKAEANAREMENGLTQKHRLLMASHETVTY